jgi:hypothetical protein
MAAAVSRFVAVLLLVFPGWMATYGFLIMKNSIFDAFGPGLFPWFKFLGGFVLFAAGVAFIGGWIFYRDRKRNYVAPRFRENKKQRR